jgi:hypothetical protein
MRRQQLEVSAAHGSMAEQLKTLPREDQDDIHTRLRTAEVLHTLQTEFSPAEIKSYVGSGGLKPFMARSQQAIDDAIGNAPDPRYARFLALVSEAKAHAFTIGGKALTGQEAETVWGFVPSGKEPLAEMFIQKLNEQAKANGQYLDRKLKAISTPRKEMAEYYQSQRKADAPRQSQAKSKVGEVIEAAPGVTIERVS